MTVERMCQLGGISRSGFYRMGSKSGGVKGVDRDVELRDAIQRIALEFPSYGRPRITAALRRQGWCVNPKRVYRILREDNLLCLRKRKFVVTTNSSHGLTIYPNLARERVPNGIDQLWVADLTYVRLELEFVYLAVILDAFSRRVIGWALDRTLEDTLTLSALLMALKQRHPKPGLVHHSDRGVQYASTDYTGLLQQHGIRISMSFGRHGEIFSDGHQIEGPEATRKPLPARRRNEFPVGYSLAGCSPAEPTSASPTACQF